MDSEGLVRTWMGTGDNQLLSDIAADVRSGRVTFVTVVKALGDFLTSEDGRVRAKGVEFLSLILARCTPETLNRQSTLALVNFYCEKLAETDTITPALGGLVEMTRFSSFTSIDITTVLHACFSQINIKALDQPTRFLVLTIVDIFMSRHRNVLKEMDKEFLSGYISLVENEKDPRNLLLTFSITRVILIEFDISGSIEALFNITFCYFPITFRPPPDNINGITSDHLKKALGTCLNATPAFGPLAIPVFLEKLVTGSPPIKRDALQAMSSCFPVYGTVLIRSFAPKIWPALKIEILQPADAATEAIALDAIKSFVDTVHSMHEDKPDGNDEVEDTIHAVCQDCIQALREPEKNQARSAIKILCVFASSKLSQYIISQAVPHIMKLFLDPEQVNNQNSILTHLSKLVTATVGLGARSSEPSSPASVVPLLQFKKPVFDIFMMGLNITGCRQPALDGLRGMVAIGTLLADEDLGVVVDASSHILVVTFDEDDLSDNLLNLLSTISGSSQWLIRHRTLPLLFNTLPDIPPSRTANVERLKCSHILSILGDLCLQPCLFEAIVDWLVKKLNSLCLSSSATGYLALEPTAAYAHSILTTLSNVLTVAVDKHPAVVSDYSDRLLPTLYGLFLYSALGSDTAPMVGTETRLIDITAQIITLTVQTISLPKQETFAAALFTAFLAGNVHGIIQDYHKTALWAAFAPFDTNAPVMQKNLVILFAAGVIALRKELSVPVPDLSAFLSQVMKWGLSAAEHAPQRDAAWRIIVAIVNKYPNDVATFLSRSLEVPFYEFAKDPPLDQPPYAVMTLARIAKALSFIDHPLLASYANSLFKLFDDKQLGWSAAKAIGELGGPDATLTKKNHAVIKVLHSQKYVNLVLPRLIEGALANESRQQTACLVALTTLLDCVPKATYTPWISSITPLLFRCLELPDDDVQVKVINTLSNITEGCLRDSDIMAEHTGTLISTMLKNSTSEKVHSIQVRLAALRYLAILPGIIRHDLLHPYKQLVTRHLVEALDDPKRFVRKEAVRTRTIWLKYNR